MLLGLALQIWPDHKLFNAVPSSDPITVLWELNEKRKSHVKTQGKRNKGKRLSITVIVCYRFQYASSPHVHLFKQITLFILCINILSYVNDLQPSSEGCRFFKY